MGLTDESIELIRASFARLMPLQEVVARRFRIRLVAMAPEVWPMAAGLAGQSKMLMATLATTVCGLRETPSLLPVAASLAARHITFGLRPEQHAQVGEALLDTFAGALGPDFKPETRAAWMAAFAALSGALAAASPAAPA